MIRVGIIGIGFGQQVHIPAFRLDSRAQVTAIAASSCERAAEVASRLGISRAARDWQEMIADPCIDAISIAVPPLLQPVIAAAALACGKPVFCEKPVAITETAARVIAEAARHAAVANVVDFEFPEIPEWREAKKLIDSGVIGGLRHVTVNWNVETYASRMKLVSWKTTTEMGGGTLYSFASHTLHYLEWFAGPVSGLSARLGFAPGGERTGDTCVALAMQLDSGASASVFISSDAFLGSGHRIEFYGDEGSLRLENLTSDYGSGFRLWLATRTTGSWEPVDTPVSPHGGDGRIAAVASLVRRFLDWIESGVPARPDFAQALRVQALLQAARRSHQSGEWIDL